MSVTATAKPIRCPRLSNNFRPWRRLILSSLALALTSFSPASAKDLSSDFIDDLAKKILQRELDLQRLNVRLHMEAANPSFNRARRTWLWDIGNAIPTESGLIAATALFFSNTRNRVLITPYPASVDGKTEFALEARNVHNHIADCKIAATIDPQIAGQVVGGAGSLLELGADCRRAFYLHKNKLDRRAVTRQVVTLKQQIDDLQQQYDALPAAHAGAYLAEGSVLKDIRNNCLGEFVRLDRNAALISTGQAIEDTVSLSRNTVGGVGNSINVLAIFRNNKRLNGEGALLNLTAASMITARPFLSNIGGWLAKRSNNQLTKELLGGAQTVNDERLASDLETLKSCHAQSAALAKTRLAIYGTQLDRYRGEKELAEEEKTKAKQTVLRRFRESIYGPTKLAQSTLNVIIGFRSQNNSTADNRLDAAGNLTYTSGQIFNIAELVRERLVDEARHARQAADHMLPEQRLGRQIEAIDKMQQQLEH